MSTILHSEAVIAKSDVFKGIWQASIPVSLDEYRLIRLPESGSDSFGMIPKCSGGLCDASVDAVDKRNSHHIVFTTIIVRP